MKMMRNDINVCRPIVAIATAKSMKRSPDNDHEVRQFPTSKENMHVIRLGKLGY